MTSGMPFHAKNGDLCDGPVGLPAHRRRILLVDEDAAATSCLARLLEAGGHEVEVANDATTAVEKAREQRPEVFVVDVGPPGTPGYRLAGRPRADGRGREVVVIAVSGHDRHGRRGPEFDDYLVKPLDLEDLIALIVGDRSVHPTNGANPPTSREEGVSHEG